MSQQESPSPPRISALRASSERVVFTEDGNRDGWIASDTTVGVEARR
jgi:uncharacterized protein YjhX (UPF0386 family)